MGVILFLRPSLLVAQDYFPISVGNRWVFRKRGGKDVRLIEVLSVQQELAASRKDQMFITKQMRLEKKWTTLGKNSRRKVEDILTTNFKTISMENIKIKAGHFLRVMCVSEEAKRQRKDRMKS